MPLAKLREKKERTQITNMKSERGDITTNSMKVEMIITEYYEQLHVHKFNKPDEMGQFLESTNCQNLPKENNLYSSFSMKEIK